MPSLKMECLADANKCDYHEYDDYDYGY